MPRPPGARFRFLRRHWKKVTWENVAKVWAALPAMIYMGIFLATGYAPYQFGNVSVIDTLVDGSCTMAKEMVSSSGPTMQSVAQNLFGLATHTGEHLGDQVVRRTVEMPRETQAYVLNQTVGEVRGWTA